MYAQLQNVKLLRDKAKKKKAKQRKCTSGYFVKKKLNFKCLLCHTEFLSIVIALFQFIYTVIIGKPFAYWTTRTSTPVFLGGGQIELGKGENRYTCKDILSTPYFAIIIQSWLCASIHIFTFA